MMVTLLPSTTSRVRLSTAGSWSVALMPNGLLLSGGIEAPQALSTAHCAIVMEAGTVQRLREATAASMVSGGTWPKWPTGETMRLLHQRMRRQRVVGFAGRIDAPARRHDVHDHRFVGLDRQHGADIGDPGDRHRRVRLRQAVVEQGLDDEHVARRVDPVAADRGEDGRRHPSQLVGAQYDVGRNQGHARLMTMGGRRGRQGGICQRPGPLQHPGIFQMSGIRRRPRQDTPTAGRQKNEDGAPRHWTCRIASGRIAVVVPGPAIVILETDGCFKVVDNVP